ncbi:amidohydrolase family protein [Bradyrhizobium sp. CCGUVB4N]|uniref:amidohydrolase family protein n=1 Tax=Bradyrhizobium sp. CCGUVB4N TaxID=2949631 RepID=UPI0020B43145|nr:amidohydrolase family protein [Bradyrhizobium sp. CCGUVB4N]MCP3381277.1 amidohydrolase family protein [Bradyrhizobium sp. CCGUVB4N]
MGLSAAALSRGMARADEVRWSSGAEKPRFLAPPGATDCHFHTYDKNYPVIKNATLLPDDALPDDYRALQRRIGTSRGVIIQPSTYGTDNRLQIASRKALGTENFRVVAVVAEDVSDADLKQLGEQGVCGVRFNLAYPGVLTFVSLKILAPKLADLGWHCQFNIRPDQLEDNAALLQSLPTKLVFDHLSQVPQPAGLDSRAYKITRELIDRGKTWVKLSGPYVTTKKGPPMFEDAGAVAAAYAKAAPERMVWGSDWPHPSEKEHKPNDAQLFDLFHDWVGGDAVFKRILVDNPVELYGFAPLSK